MEKREEKVQRKVEKRCADRRKMVEKMNSDEPCKIEINFSPVDPLFRCFSFFSRYQTAAGIL